MYLTVDGGGSKLSAICFDAEYRMIRRAKSGGVNPTQNDPESIRKHVEECLDAVLAGESEIDEAFVVFVGDRILFETILRSKVYVEKLTFLDEAKAGLIAGAGLTTGLLAIAGTGSDVFYISEDARKVVGGWGIVLGDQGSGTWIGLKAIRMVIRSLDGWGHETALTQKILQYFDAEDEPRKIISSVYNAPAPFPVIAKLAPIVAEAAHEGDPFALHLFRDAGSTLGRQMLTLLAQLQEQQISIPEEITLCGGAWKGHPAMQESFSETVAIRYPKIQVHMPWFEHVMAGPILLELHHGRSREEARAILAAAFPQEVIAL